MKKVLALILTAVMVMGLLAACGLAILRVFKGKEEDTAE